MHYYSRKKEKKRQTSFFFRKKESGLKAFRKNRKAPLFFLLRVKREKDLTLLDWKGKGNPQKASTSSYKEKRELPLFLEGKKESCVRRGGGVLQ